MGQNVTQLPTTTGPASTDPAGGSLSGNGITISGEAFHPNGTYTLSTPTTAVPAGSTVSFFDDVYDEATGMNVEHNLGQATVANGVATLPYTPTTLGVHIITANYFGPGTTIAGAMFAGQFDVEVTSAPAATGGTGGSTGSADSLPVIGNVLKSLGL